MSELGDISQAADELHLCERSDGSCGECARGARDLEAERLHLGRCVSETVVSSAKQWRERATVVDAGGLLGDGRSRRDETRPVSGSC